MQSPHHLLSDIQQQAADLAATIHRYECHYGPLPPSLQRHLSTLLSSFIINHSPLALGPTPTASSTPLAFSPMSFSQYMKEQAELVHSRGQHTLSEHYRNALSVFMRFLEHQDISITDITPDLIKSFEVWLLNVRRIKRNTSSFYMRQLRAVYNRAVRQGLTPDQHPFRGVYTGVDQTRHRALSLEEVRQLRHLDLTQAPDLAQARDLFLFSYYTRGMSLIDMAHLRPSDISNGQLTYSRRKTHQTLTIRWEPEMQQLVDRLNANASSLIKNNPSSIIDREYLLPILKSSSLIANHSSLIDIYRSSSSRLNAALHRLSHKLHLSVPLTMYVARHTWASNAFHQGTPVSIIGQALGHSGTSERTTTIYLASMNHQVIDRANRALLNEVGKAIHGMKNRC